MKALDRFLGCSGYVLCLLLLALQPRVQAGVPSVCISEFMADNQNGLKDEDGDSASWIELYNPSSTTVNLSGWFLTDSRTNLTKWRFPSVSLLPDKYLVVYASGKDRAPDVAHLHTNFRLDPQGGHLALVNRATNVVSEFPNYPKQAPDRSYGRAPGELTIVGPLSQPTPGKLNATQGAGFAAEVKFEPAGGTVVGPTNVQLSCRSPRAIIHYTTDGTLPTSRSAIYQAPVAVTNTLQLRARAYEDGLLPGPPQSRTYLYLQADLRSFTSTLPVLVVEAIDQDRGNQAHDSVGEMVVFEPVNGSTSLTNHAALTTRVGFHLRGSSTMNMPKPSFALHLLNEFDQEHHQSLLGMPADSDWVLYAPNRFEPVMIHNPFVHQLSRDMGRYSPRTRFVEVFFISGSGRLGRRRYAGIYVLEEKIKIGKHRVDIDRLGAADLKPPEVTGGYLLKLDRLGPNEDGLWAGNASMVYVEPKEALMTLAERAPQLNYLSSYFGEFERVLRSPNWKDPKLGYAAYIDVDAWIDYHVLEVLSGNVDAFIYSTYFYKPRNGKLVFGPHWDFDRALGSTDGRDDEPRRWTTGRFFSGPWWNQLFRDPDFWQRWVDRWQELRQKQFSLEHINSLIDRLAGQLREAQPREVERWDLQPRGGSYQAEIDLMKDWLSNRIDFIDEQLVTKPRLDVPAGIIKPGAELGISVPNNATMYYTLDGSDPRAPQGGVAVNAQVYSAAVRVETNGCLVARAYDPSKRQLGGPRTSTPWSGAIRAKLVVRGQRLEVITD